MTDDHVVVKDWYGRLGNNLICVYRLLLSVICRDIAAATVPSHPFLLDCSFGTVLPDSRVVDTDSETVYSDFAGVDHQQFVREWALHEAEVVRMARNVFSPSQRHLTPLPDDSLVIHMRSGDVMQQKGVAGYVLPPLFYFVAVVRSGYVGKEIVILCEDNENPCLGALLRFFPKARHAIRSLEQDVEILLSARNIACSVGSFATSLATVSQCLKKLYIPNYVPFYHRAFLPSWVDVKLANLSDYYRFVTPWALDEKRRRLLLLWPRTGDVLARERWSLSQFS